MPRPEQPKPPESRRRRALAATLGIGLAVVMVFQAWLLAVSHARAIERIAIRAANRAQSNADRIASLFRQIDLTLLDVRGHIHAAEVFGGRDSTTTDRRAEVTAIIRERMARIPHVRILNVIAADGNNVFSSDDTLPTANIADRPYFHAQREADADRLVVSQPLLGRVTGRYGIFCTRRLTMPDGRFAGILLANLDAEDLSDELRAVDQEHWTLAAIARGRLLASRRPSRPADLGRQVQGMDWITDQVSHRGPGLGETTARVWGCAVVEGQAMTVVAGATEAFALTQWQQDLKAQGLASLLLAIGAVAVVALQRRREKAACETEELDRRLRSSENALAEVVARVPVGVFRLATADDGALSVAYASPRCVEMAGPATSLAMIRDLIHPDDRASLGPAIADARIHGSFAWSGRIRHGGALRWVDVSATAGGGEWHGFVQDSTGRREAQAALARQQELQRAVFEHAPVGICLIDPERRVIVAANPAACAIHDRPLAAMIGASPLDFLHPDDLERTKAAVARAREPDAAPQRITIRGRTGGGRLIDLEMVMTTIRDGQGRPVNGLAIFQDVTEAKRMADQLRQSEKMQAVGLLAGGIAHDFNNILAAIAGYTELASRRSPGAAIAAHLREIAAAADRARTLVQQILTFSRRAPGERGPVHLQSTVREVLNLLRATLPSSVTMSVELSPAVNPVMADPGRIHQVVMNLCSNAVHAMAGRGELRIVLDQITVDAPTPGRLGTIAAGSYARLSVTDTGTGMDAATVERIFEPFFTTKGPDHGTGLGLSVVWGVVETHGGDIQIDTAVGQGTTFRILLPVMAAEETSTPAPPRAELPRGDERILVVDDEPALRSIYGELLGELGYRVRTGGNGLEAMAILRESADATDLLITDQTMPGMTGDELAAVAIALHPGLPIIICSGLNCRPDAAGDDPLRAWCTKPLDYAELARTVRRLLDARRR